MGNCLTIRTIVTRFCPIHLVMSQSLCSMPPYDWANGGSVDVLEGGEDGFSNVGVGVILGNWQEIQGQNYVTLLQGSEMTAGFHYRNWILCI